MKSILKGALIVDVIAIIVFFGLLFFGPNGSAYMAVIPGIIAVENFLPPNCYFALAPCTPSTEVSRILIEFVLYGTSLVFYSMIGGLLGFMFSKVQQFKS